MRGKAVSAEEAFLAIEDHPRLCGEKFTRLFLSMTAPGSPPPMRGKDGAAVKKEIKKRITPAYAGKSHFSEIVLTENKDHPRLCGEK